MTNTTNKTWLQWLGILVQQSFILVRNRIQLNRIQTKVFPMVEENSVPNITEYIKQFQEKPWACGITIYDADYGAPMLVPDMQSDFYCNKYKPGEMCNEKCDCTYGNRKLARLQKERIKANNLFQEAKNQVWGRTK